ncbi:peptidoglycan-binding protein [Micromonospora sp. NPDC000207]|uniref:peptidoglycan-binding protein n=1 Tax=Micromonospora sp. NPDC000207 TaxID=3154246 RepID=UPI00332A5018
MKFVSRAGWGARPTTPNGDARIDTNLGVKIHYLGSPYRILGHENCAAKVRSVQSGHLNEGYWEIAYSLVVCRHGYVYEGRGANVQCGANGSRTLNRNHYAVLGMVGTSLPGLGSIGLGYLDTKPTDEMRQGLREAIAYLRRYGGARGEILGHRDGFPTRCPGGPLYDMLRAGFFEPGANSGPVQYVTVAGDTLGSVAAKFRVPWSTLAEANGLPMVLTGSHRFVVGTRLTIPGQASSPDPQGGGTPITGYVPFPGTEWFEGRPNSRIITAMGVRLVQEGCNPYRVGPGSQWSDVDRDAYAMWQRKLGFTGADADGWPGRTSWDRLRVPSEGGVSAGPVGYEPFPGAAWFRANPNSSVVTAMGVRLVAEGCGAYLSGPGPRWTGADRTSYANWQRKLGFSGGDADGWPGQTSWDRLRVPRQGGGLPYEQGGAPGRTYESFPGAQWFRGRPNSAVVTEMGRRLVAEGCGRYTVGPGPQWSDVDRESYAAWQRKLGFSGADADGWPGRSSWEQLRVPRYTEQYQPYPGANWFRSNPSSPIVTNMGRRLVAEGCGQYRIGPGPQWSDVDRQSYAAWQRKLGFSGADADGWPGQVTWDRLRVPRA